MRLLPLLLLPLLAACPDGRTCIQECRDDSDFFETCMASDGTLCGGWVVAYCVDDVQAYWDCETCGWEEMAVDGIAHVCTSPADVTRHCIHLTRGLHRVLPEGDWAAWLDECQAGGTPIADAIDAADCEALCALFDP